MARKKQRYNSVAEMDSFILQRIGPIMQACLLGVVWWGFGKIENLNTSLVGIKQELAGSKEVSKTHDEAIKELKQKQNFFSEHFMTREEVTRHFEKLENKIDTLRDKTSKDN